MSPIDSSEAVLAGSPAFLGTMLPPLAARLGARPRVADAPHQAFALCQEGARLLVYEYRSHEWLPLAEDVKNAFGESLAVLVALPQEMAAMRGVLAGAGVDETLSWDGRPEPLVAAAARMLGAEPIAPHAPTEPAAPAAPEPPGARPAAAGPSVTPVRPRPAVAPVTANRPPPLAERAAGTRAAAVPPVLGRAPAPARGEPPSLAAGDAAAAPSHFEELGCEEPSFSIEEAPPDASARWGDAELVAFEPSATWPGTVLAARDAEGLLAGAVSGFWPEMPELKSHAERVVGLLSLLERDALAGRPVAVDPAPVCRAAALRWQVSAALASAPAPGSPVDQAAVRAILAELDAVLGVLKRAEAGAPPAGLPGIDQLRRDLVAEAVDLADAVHRIASHGVEGAESARAAPGAAGRLLSIRAEAAERVAPGRRPVALWALLAVAGLCSAAYHGYRYVSRRTAPRVAGVAGAPAGAFAVPELPGGRKVVVLPPGAGDPQSMEKLKEQQELLGNVVRLEKGVMIITPGRPATPSGPGEEAKP